jgi:hypothetical protein
MSIWVGIAAAAGILVILFKIGFRKVIHYDIPIDIMVTLALMWMFAGTYSGMIAAVTGGLFTSFILIALKRTFPHDGFHLPKIGKS